MVHQIFALLFVGLGLVRATSPGTVAGLADVSPVLPNLRISTQGFPSVGNFASRSGTVNQELEAQRRSADTTFAQKRADFQAKLQTIRDQQKKALLDRLNTNMNAINKKRTDMMIAYLTRMGEILDKVENRARELKAKGKDTSSVDAAIATARTAIATAKAAVLAQAGKDYTISISTETTVRTDTGVTAKAMQADLKTVFDLVKQAHQSVGDAVRALAAILGEKIPPAPTATTSAGVSR